MPKISVVIPVYNSEKTIKETVDSVLNQTLQDFELLVIDDGSEDSTIDILASIKDPRLKVFTKPHSGVSASRNYGISQAQGVFIAFLDADDLWTPDKLESQMKALEENTQAAVAYSWTDFIDESSRFLHPGLHIRADGDVYTRLLVLNFLESGSNPLIRREALIEVGGFEGSIEGFEDWEMWVRLAKRYHFVTVPIPQILYRRTTSSLSSNILRQEEMALKAIKLVFSQAPKSVQHLKKHSYARAYEYLAFRALDGPPGRRKGFLAMKFLFKAIRNNPALLIQARLMSSFMFKITVSVILPPSQAEMLLCKVSHLIKNSALTRVLPK